MNKQPLHLSHRPLIIDACKRLNLPLSEYNFSNLYLFRKAHEYHLVEHGESLFIQGISRDHKSFLMPLFQPRSFHELHSIAKNLGLSYLFPIPEAWSHQVASDGFSMTFSESDSDYLYEKSSIEGMHGRHVDGQRNLIRHLLDEHSMTVKPIDLETIKDAFSILEHWTSERKDPNESDAISSEEALQLFFELSLQGWIFYADEKAVGFLLGEPLTQEIFLIHFSKASPVLKGIYPFMFQEGSKRIDPQYTYLNWEQDLGLENIRHMKHSYHPHQLVKKGWIQC